MALTVKIDKFHNDTEDNTKKMVGLEVVVNPTGFHGFTKKTLNDVSARQGL